MPDQTVLPRLVWPGRAHDGTGAGSALNNGRGFGGDCAHSHACQGGSSGVQGELGGGKHGANCSRAELREFLALDETLATLCTKDAWAPRDNVYLYISGRL